MTHPLVSVITAAYNAEKYIGDCMSSVIRQTYKNWDMWIVDDASKDDTQKIVEAYAQEYPNIHYIRLNKNSGCPAVPRNVGLEKSNADLIAFLDADDMLMPEKLKHQIAFMQSKNAALSYTGYRRITPDGDKTGHFIAVPDKMTYKKYLANTCILLSSSMVDRSKMGDIRFDEQLRHRGREDLLLWIDLLKKYEGHGLNEDLARYRRGHDSVSSNIGSGMMRNWAIYHERLQDMTEFERIKAFGGYVFNAMKKRLVF